MLVERHQSRIRGYLRQLCGNPAAADDLAQETFIRAWDKLATYSGRGRFSAWLMSIAHNAFLQAVRKTGREARRLSDLAAESGDGATHGASVSAPFDGELADLPRLLSVLSEPERAVMVLSYGYGYSHGEIAEVTGMALGTVKSHIHRAKARIRARFDLEGPGDA